MLAGLAATPVAGLPALAAPVAPISEALRQALARHTAAQAAVDAASGPEDLPEHLLDAAADALDDLVSLPCSNDAELLEKLRYLLAAELHVIGEPPTAKVEFGSMPRSLFVHFHLEARS